MAKKQVLTQHFNFKQTPQSQPIPGSPQVPNSAGGFVWAVDDWTRLHRFLILGSDGGTYYISEKQLTIENAQAVVRCIAADGPRTVATIVEVSDSGRAPKNDPAIFALALAASLGDAATKRAALLALPKVCRIGTHLFHFTAYIETMRGWGRGLRNAIARWYDERSAKDLALQVAKYQQRDAWSHRDLLRLAHPKAADEQHQAIYHWVVKNGWDWIGDETHPDPALRLLWAFERAKRATSAWEIVVLIYDYGLPRECIPTQWLNDANVWEALLGEGAMPLTAMIRNLATMTRVGLLERNSAATEQVIATLHNAQRLKAARVHPIAILTALKSYAAGKGIRGQNTWTPVQPIVEALNDAFYLSFGNVTPTGKRWLLGLDVSGSMGGGMVAGVPGLTPRAASAAMALVTANTEAQHRFVAFQDKLVPFDIKPSQRLDEVVKSISNLPFGRTDCSQPMLYALEHKLPVDVFAIYTDSETWAGNIHPTQALRQYRQQMGIDARLIVVGMVSNGFSIADPNDGGMLDVVGFDTSTPEVMSQFATGL